MIRRQSITAEELLELPDDGNFYELVNGELRVMSPAGYDHGKVVLRVSLRIGQHALANDLGDVLSEDTGFTLRRKPDTVRAPDVSFVRKDRSPPQQSGFAELAPDLAVEVVSPGDRKAAIKEKVQDYLQAGVRLIWVLRPQTQTVDEYRPGMAVKKLNRGEMINGYDVLPGFRCRIAEFFP